MLGPSHSTRRGTTFGIPVHAARGKSLHLEICVRGIAQHKATHGKVRDGRMLAAGDVDESVQRGGDKEAWGTKQQNRQDVGASLEPPPLRSGPLVLTSVRGAGLSVSRPLPGNALATFSPLPLKP